MDEVMKGVKQLELEETTHGKHLSKPWQAKFNRTLWQTKPTQPMHAAGLVKAGYQQDVAVVTVTLL